MGLDNLYIKGYKNGNKGVSVVNKVGEEIRFTIDPSYTALIRSWLSVMLNRIFHGDVAGINDAITVRTTDGVDIKRYGSKKWEMKYPGYIYIKLTYNQLVLANAEGNDTINFRSDMDAGLIYGGRNGAPLINEGTKAMCVYSELKELFK